MGSPLEIPALIARKRDGGELTGSEIQALIDGYLAGEVAEAQMAALLMAGVIRGFTRSEAIALTEVMLASGDQVSLAGLRGPTVDKHSTGGVGDTTTLIVLPILAAAGMQVAKLSGRGLGHTGGTLDKLESIPGVTVELTVEQVRAQVERVGIAVAAATGDLVPADKQLYALRDITGTVPSAALIASSIMSKKLAGGADHILLDVKTGNGSLVGDLDAARALATLCVDIGQAHGRRTGALVTDMSQPLSDAIGNALEVAAAIEVLQGSRQDRLAEVSRHLAAGVLELAGVPDPQAVVASLMGQHAPLEAFREWIQTQGGDPSLADDPWKILPRAPVVREWAPGRAVVQVFQCRRLGELAGRLGAGRIRAGDVIDPAVGLEVLARIGERIEDGQPLVRVHARSADEADAVIGELPGVVDLGEREIQPPPLVYDAVGISMPAP